MKIFIRSLPFVISMFFFACNKDVHKVDVLLLETKSVEYDSSIKDGFYLSARQVVRSNDNPVKQGFVYGLQKNPTIDSDAVIYAPLNGESNFSIKATDALMRDTTYYVRSFIISDDYITYGNEVSFRSFGSKPPVIEKIEPAIAFWGDTIMIIGDHFDRNGKNNIVLFNDLEAKVIQGKNDTIYAIVPQYLAALKCDVNVKLYGNKSEKGKQFDIFLPQINAISNSTGQCPDTITIKGNYLSSQFGKILFGEYSITPIINSKREIKFKVPFLGDNQTVSIKYKLLDQEISVINQFQYHHQSLLSLSTDSIYHNDRFTLYANNIDFRKINSVINIDGFYCPLIQSWQDSASFSFDVPFSEYQNTSFKINVYIEEKLIKDYTIYRQKPKITECNTRQIAYNGTITLNVKGYYDLYESGINFIKSDGSATFIENRTGNYSQGVLQLSSPESLGPGNYKLQIKSLGLLSDPVSFQIKEPEVDPFNSINLKRGAFIEVNGNYLPKDTKFFQFRHLESDRVFPFNTNTLEGSGEYQLELKLADQTYQYPFKITLNDPFDYVGKINVSSDQYKTKNMMCFAKDGFLYLCNHNSATVEVVNINNGSHQTKNTNLNFSETGDWSYWTGFSFFPVMFNNNVYVNFLGNIFEFNPNSFYWDKVTLPSEIDSITSLGASDSELIAISSNNDIWKYNGYWTKIGNSNIAKGYLWCAGDYIYSIDQLKLSVYNKNDFSFVKKVTSPIGYSGNYYPTMYYFTKDNNLYQTIYETKTRCNFIKFSTQLNKFESITPSSIPDTDLYFQFCPDVNGDIYYVHNLHIYKFNP